MLKTIEKTIVNHKMISYGDNIVVGLSGGADSVCLLIALLELKEKLGFGEITAVHVNHGLREEAFNDEKFVNELCLNLGIKALTLQADVKTYAKVHKLGIEESGRILRYSLMEEALNTLKAKKIAVGHNIDDNAETVLMNLCRGTGLKGLCGIPPVNKFIIRPLIEVTREKIEKYLNHKNISFITDHSNYSNDYTRNRVRNIILPMLKSEINPKAVEIISRNTKGLIDDSYHLESIAYEIYNLIAKETPNGVEFSINMLKNHYKAMLARIVRLAISKIKNSKEDISSKHIESVLDLLNGHSGREVNLGAVVVKKEYNKIIFSEVKHEEKVKGFSHEIKLNSTLYIPEIKKSIYLSDEPPKTPNLLCTKELNCVNLLENVSLKIRTRQKGDKITLGGTLEGKKRFTKKLQDYFTDEKIPKSQRDSIPLLDCGNEIICIFLDKIILNTKYEGSKNENKKYWISLLEG